MPPRIHKDLGPGTPPPLYLGAVPRNGGVEFILFSRHATSIKLLLYDSHDGEPTDEIWLDPKRNRRGDLWFVFVPGIHAGQIYAYQVDGPDWPEAGHRFDSSTVLIDPIAKATTSNLLPADRATPAYESTIERPRCVVVSDDFDWQQARPPGCPLADSIIYEAHVRGLTMHPSAGAASPGTFLGVIEKIPYLKELGVTAVELLPVHEFDHLEIPRQNPATGAMLVNYWGYSPVGFFAPNGRYCSSPRPGSQVEEFKTMVRELHRAGIEVILDVVFNHTAEGNHDGPTIHFKGIDNSIYYFLMPDQQYYRDFSGCGNSLNSNHPIVRQMLRNCLRYWVIHMGIDGFRFDLASVLSRDRSGHLVSEAPLLDGIAEDPVLRSAKIIAEAWDAAGAYQVGSFPGGRWAEWNGKYRDDVRQFWRGDFGKTGAFATRIAGSSDLYQRSGRKPYHSINFITAHDGFTLGDLVAYNHKHNEANGEGNRDGENNNFSYNYGFEGPTTSARIERIRVRQIKNFLATLFWSQGVPMLLAGDEMRRSQRGNNNAYCQDNDISWLDWNLVDQNAEIFRFCKALIAFRRRHPVLRRTEFFNGKPLPDAPTPDVLWFAADGSPMDWSEDTRTLMVFWCGSRAALVHETGDDVLLMFNANRESVEFQVPAAGQDEKPWRLFADTGCPAPRDVFPDGDGPMARPLSRYPMLGRSAACFYRGR